MVLTGVGPTGDGVLMIERGLSQAPDRYLDCCTTAARVVVITDREVAALHAPALSESLASSGRLVHTLVIEGSEAAKSLEGVGSIYEQLSDINCSRDDVILALGGGSIIDMATFAAATYLGGIQLVIMPTSLASMIDSSVSNKCYLNFRSSRNVIQTTGRPQRIIIDPDYLNSLTPRQLANGYAQVIRYGMVSDPELINLLMAEDLDVEVIIRRAVQARINTERENTDCLDFGRLVSDAIEGHFRFLKYQHGEALALGMLAACPTEQMRELLQKHNLPTTLEGVTPETIIRRIVKSMQAQGSHSYSIVRIESAGKPYLQTFKPEEAEALVSSLIAELEPPA